MDFDWSDANAIGDLRIGDFACGTGALLSAVYDQIAVRHEQAGGDLEALHPVMMEEVLYGCDVMPSAIHITGSTLSGAQPSVGFGKTRLHTATYGRQHDESVRIGSLELIQSSSLLSNINISDPTRRTGSTGEEEESVTQFVANVPDDAFDLVIMNPPFTSNTKHYAADQGVMNAAFAAYNSTEDDQKRMADRLKQLTDWLKQVSDYNTYHGHAGLASAFVSVAHRKLRPGGVLALVLPLTSINGATWTRFREIMATKYRDLTVVSIAANNKDMSFSSETGMADCLVVARKVRIAEARGDRGKFVSLGRRPHGFSESSAIARQIVGCDSVRDIEDGPFGGNVLNIGDSPVGEMLEAPTDGFKTGWGVARISDATLAQVAHSLASSKLWLPQEAAAIDLQIAELNQVGKRGLHHGVIAVKSSGGPFVKTTASPTATYPSLWNHSASNETRIVW